MKIIRIFFLSLQIISISKSFATDVRPSNQYDTHFIRVIMNGDGSWALRLCRTSNIDECDSKALQRFRHMDAEQFRILHAQILAQKRGFLDRLGVVAMTGAGGATAAAITMAGVGGAAGLFGGPAGSLVGGATGGFSGAIVGGAVGMGAGFIALNFEDNRITALGLGAFTTHAYLWNGTIQEAIDLIERASVTPLPQD